MSCPDNLLIGYRRGALSDEEQTRLDGHLAGCPTCRLTLQVGSDFDRVLDTVPRDDLLAARFARNLGTKLERARPQRERARYAAVAAVALAVLASAGLAAAKLGGAWPFSPSTTESAVRAGHAQGRGASPPRARTAAPEPAAELEPAAAQLEPNPEAPAPEETVADRAPRAAELFAQANTLRREGEPKRARALYRQLEQLYPRSPEMEIAHVSLGRVHLELGEPREALEQFERYLKQHPRGALAEEALFGQASALERLGRGAAERRTWQTLLAGYPRSVYADRARHRLERIP